MLLADRIKSDKHSLSNQRGSMLVFIAFFILPVVFFLYSLSIDVSTYFTEYRTVQKALDTASLQAYKFLPDQTSAHNSAVLYLADWNINDPELVVETTADTIKLSYNGLVNMPFANFFGLTDGITVYASSVARGTPFEAYIAIDNSSYLAPDLFSGTSWGDSNSWNELEFFTYSDLPQQEDGTSPDPLLWTQQCFNPAFSAVKESAINIYQYLAAFHLNTVGVSFFPGRGTYVEPIRALVPGGVRDSGLGESDFLSDVDLATDYFSRNDYCAAAAERASLEQAHYQFPDIGSGIGGVWSPEGTPTNISTNLSGEWRYDHANDSTLTTAQVIWSRSVRRNQQANTFEVLKDLRSQLLGANTLETRGGLMNRTVKKGIIIAGDLPIVDGVHFPAANVQSRLQEEIEAFKDNLTQDGPEVKLYYLAFYHPGLGVDEATFMQHIEELRAFFNSVDENYGGKWANFSIQVISRSSGSEMVQDALSRLALERRSGVLSQ